MEDRKMTQLSDRKMEDRKMTQLSDRKMEDRKMTQLSDRKMEDRKMTPIHLLWVAVRRSILQNARRKTRRLAGALPGKRLVLMVLSGARELKIPSY
jgi:hypothetical protein